MKTEILNFTDKLATIIVILGDFLVTDNKSTFSSESFCLFDVILVSECPGRFPFEMLALFAIRDWDKIRRYHYLQNSILKHKI